MMTAYFPLQEAPAFRLRNLSVWHQFFATITEKPTPRAEDALPPALWIELERRRPDMPSRQDLRPTGTCGCRVRRAAAPRGPGPHDFGSGVQGS